jgi:hypothetical protein
MRKYDNFLLKKFCTDAHRLIFRCKKVDHVATKRICLGSYIFFYGKGLEFLFLGPHILLIHSGINT